MAGQHREDDDVAFFAADIGLTRRLAASPVAAQLPDNQGPLPPGRYLLFFDDADESFTKLWIRMGKFVPGEVLPVVADVPWFPMGSNGIVSIETNVREGVNDRLAAITSAGTVNVYITAVSRNA